MFKDLGRNAEYFLAEDQVDIIYVAPECSYNIVST